MAERDLKFGLTDEIRRDLARVFARYPEIDRVVIFGSRAKGSFRDGSDINLAVFAREMSEARFTALLERDRRSTFGFQDRFGALGPAATRQAQRQDSEGRKDFLPRRNLLLIQNERT